ncbi:MAG: hypothetical protein Q8Q06_04300 [bacterium]|nr:hypothetical protein [bacterium]
MHKAGHHGRTPRHSERHDLKRPKKATAEEGVEGRGAPIKNTGKRSKEKQAQKK